MKNSDIANIFSDIAELLSLKNENPFKIRAYQKAARSIELSPKELEAMVREGQDVDSIPGVGSAIAGKIREIIETGRLEYYDQLRAEFPDGVTSLLRIPGIGPKTAIRIAAGLGVKTIEDLEQALADGRVATLSRLGGKTAAKLLEQVRGLRNKDRRILIGEALPVVDALMSQLAGVDGLRNLTPAGSLRRLSETIGDLDLMGTADDPQQVIDFFVSLPAVYHVLAKGATKASVVVAGGLQVDLRLVEHDRFGSLLQYFTGSQQHNIALRERARRKGLSLSEYGITDISTGVTEKFETEEAFYARLGMQYIPPELREARGEIDAAETYSIPRLINQDDIRGDLHVHSGWTDGKGSVADMRDAARRMGYSYFAVTDHSHALGIARGLDQERLQQQVQEIRDLNNKDPSFMVLTGIEVDIKADGSLDLPDDVLESLDIVIASVHSSMHQPASEMTARVLRAIKNPHVDIIGHPTCRILGSRDPVSLDIEAVFQAAARSGTALEINSAPQRLDLKDIHAFRARELGIKIAVTSDAHNQEQFGFARYGLGAARRGWCREDDVLNCLPVEDLLQFLRRRRGN